jgi:hypothetical protein
MRRGDRDCGELVCWNSFREETEIAEEDSLINFLSDNFTGDVILSLQHLREREGRAMRRSLGGEWKRTFSI